MSAFSKHGHDAYLCKPPAARHVEHAMAGRQEGYKRVALAHVAAMGAWPGRWGGLCLSRRTGCSVRHSGRAFTAIGCRCLSATDGPGPGVGVITWGVRSRVMMVRLGRALSQYRAPGLTSSSAHIPSDRFHRALAGEARNTPAAGAFVQVARVLQRDLPGGPLPRRAVAGEDLR